MNKSFVCDVFQFSNNIITSVSTIRQWLMGGGGRKENIILAGPVCRSRVLNAFGEFAAHDTVDLRHLKTVFVVTHEMAAPLEKYKLPPRASRYTLHTFRVRFLSPFKTLRVLIFPPFRLKQRLPTWAGRVLPERDVNCHQCWQGANSHHEVNFLILFRKLRKKRKINDDRLLRIENW